MSRRELSRNGVTFFPNLSCDFRNIEQTHEQKKDFVKIFVFQSHDLCAFQVIVLFRHRGVCGKDVNQLTTLYQMLKVNVIYLEILNQFFYKSLTIKILSRETHFSAEYICTLVFTIGEVQLTNIF